MRNQKPFSKFESGPAGWVGQGLKSILALPLAAAGSWILYSHLAIDHNLPLPKALPGERRVFDSTHAGMISYYVSQAEQGRPLVLVHSVNAAASAFEMQPLFLYYMSRRPVYALDLPGFGFSERSKRAYTPELYVNAIQDFLTSQVGEPADIVCLSLSSEFTAQAALTRPDLFASIVMISPTGFNFIRVSSTSQQFGQGGWNRLAHPAFSFPAWARPLYDLLTTRASIEYFLKKSFIGPVPADLLEYDYITAHQPGAEHAPLYFISGKLFTPGIRQNVYEHLQVPTLVLYDRDNFVSFGMLDEALANNKYLRAVRLIPSLGLPHFEQLEDTTQVLNHYWD